MDNDIKWCQYSLISESLGSQCKEYSLQNLKHILSAHSFDASDFVHSGGTRISNELYDDLYDFLRNTRILSKDHIRGSILRTKDTVCNFIFNAIKNNKELYDTFNAVETIDSSNIKSILLNHPLEYKKFKITKVFQKNSNLYDDLCAYLSKKMPYEMRSNIQTSTAMEWVTNVILNLNKSTSFVLKGTTIHEGKMMNTDITDRIRAALKSIGYDEGFDFDFQTDGTLFVYGDTKESKIVHDALRREAIMVSIIKNKKGGTLLDYEVDDGSNDGGEEILMEDDEFGSILENIGLTGGEDYSFIGNNCVKIPLSKLSSVLHAAKHNGFNVTPLNKNRNTAVLRFSKISDIHESQIIIKINNDPSDKWELDLHDAMDCDSSECDGDDEYDKALRDLLFLSGSADMHESTNHAEVLH